MTSLTAHTSASVVKTLLIGESGSGKTGSLASLAMTGMKLHILDYDSGLTSLATVLRAKSPESLANVDFVTLRDLYKSGPTGPILNGLPKAFVNGMKMLDNWSPKSIGQDGEDLGPPKSWGPNHCLVIDSLTFLGDAAYNQADALNPTAKDKRNIYYSAQEAVEHVLSLVTADEFNTNVIVISHIRYVERPDGTMKGYASAIGGALSPKIPTYFNSMSLMEQFGTPPKRTMKTVSTALIDLKNPNVFTAQAPLPIETAMADLFKNLKGTP